MAGDPRPVAKAEAFFGAIQRGARERATTAEIWDAIRSRADELGVRYPSTILQDVNRLRGVASGLARTSRAIANARDDQSLDRRFIGQQLYARDLNAQATAPSFHVRFQVDVTRPEGTSSEWYTLGYDAVLPATVGELLADVEAYAQSLGGDYGIEIGDVGSVELGAF